MPRMPPDTVRYDWSMRGRYASYWNAFLLPAATKLGQGHIFTSVCLSTGGEGVCLSACWDTPPRSRHPNREQTHPPEQLSPPSRPPLGADNPPEQTPHRSRHPIGADPPGSRLQHTVNERPVRILLECILV